MYMKWISVASLVVLFFIHINRHIPTGSQSLGIIVTMKKDQSKHQWPQKVFVVHQSMEWRAQQHLGYFKLTSGTYSQLIQQLQPLNFLKSTTSEPFSLRWFFIPVDNPEQLGEAEPRRGVTMVIIWFTRTHLVRKWASSSSQLKTIQRLLL